MEKQEKLTMHTANIADANFIALAKMFPNAVTETIDENGEVVRAIDADVLAQEINTKVVSGKEERYQFTWPDKKESALLANAPIAATLRPCREESVDFDNTENLYIEGDNLDVLKLLRETYLNRVKMIYIDPPYNTGNDFIYEDDFAEDTGEFLRRDGQYDEQGNRLTTNFDSNGRFHTDWLNMMYPRLRVARDLLRDDGVIFISIDDNEVHNLRKICDDVFGERNYIDILHWKRKKQPSFLAKHTAKVMEYILVYSKNEKAVGKLSIENISDKTKKVVNLTNNFSVRHFKKGVRVKIGNDGVIKKGVYSIKSMKVEYLDDVIYRDGVTINEVDVKAQFSVSQELINKFIDDNLLFITVNFGLRRDVSLEEQDKEKAITDLLLDWGDNQDSDKEQQDLFGGKYFDYAKPTKLVYNLAKSISRKDDLILDFFSGSATTAHAVMQLNAEDGGNRKFIMVQIPEKCDERSEAYKAGYKNICEIGKERIRRAGAKIKEENKDKEGIENLDTGFRVLKLDSSNMKEVYYTPEEYSQMGFNLDGFIDNIKPDRSDEDLLFQVMLDLGIPLSAKIEQKDNIFSVNDNYLIACFDKVDTSMITQIAKKQPCYAVFRDSSFINDSALVNVEQIFNTYSPYTKRRVL